MQTKRYVFSIIIPVFNGADYLERTVGSVLAQTVKDIEIIIVDDHSSDNSFQIAQNLCSGSPDIFLYKNEGQRGQGFCRNLGCEKARGKYIAFLDCDDFLENDFLEVLSYPLKDPAIDFAACGYDKITKDDFLYSYLPPIGQQKGGAAFLPLLKKTELLVWNKLYKKSFLAKYQLKHRLPFYGEDWLFSLECYLNAREYYNVPSTSYYYYQRHDSFTHVPLRTEEFPHILEFLSNLGSILEKSSLLPQERAHVSRQLLYSLLHCYLLPVYERFTDAERNKLHESIKAYFPESFAVIAMLFDGLAAAVPKLTNK